MLYTNKVAAVWDQVVEDFGGAATGEVRANIETGSRATRSAALTPQNQKLSVGHGREHSPLRILSGRRRGASNPSPKRRQQFPSIDAALL